MQIGIQGTYLALFLVGAVMLLVYHPFKLRTARWPVYFSLVIALMVLFIRSFKSVYYFMESVPSASAEIDESEQNIDKASHI